MLRQVPLASWQRQRKVVAAPFNENINKFVWSESLSQARDMIQAWTSQGQSGVLGIAKDTRTLSLDVLAATGFRKSYKFRASFEPGTDEARNYRGSLATVMDHALFIMVVPPKLLKAWFVPKAWRKIGQARDEFKQYMLNMFNEEQRLLKAGAAGTGNLMSAMVRQSETSHHRRTECAEGEDRGLTLDEILGNTFLINFAGHDTTANLLAYSCFLLAAYPEVQGWVSEEVNEILPVHKYQDWSYADAFPRLKRCQAVLVSPSGILTAAGPG